MSVAEFRGHTEWNIQRLFFLCVHTAGSIDLVLSSICVQVAGCTWGLK